jgi:hypothetical protein
MNVIKYNRRQERKNIRERGGEGERQMVELNLQTGKGTLQHTKLKKNLYSE